MRTFSRMLVLAISLHAYNTISSLFTKLIVYSVLHIRIYAFTKLLNPRYVGIIFIGYG